jgi:patatin-like phospholipase/acyl hydrolase
MTPATKIRRILSIDGGGIRAIIPGQILTVLEEKLRERSGRPESRLVDYFDLIAGTGSGGILAGAYLSPVKRGNPSPRFTAQQVVDLLTKFGGRIFNESFDHKILTFGGLLDEKYDARDLEGLLQEYFGDIQLSHVLKPCLIPAYEITRRQAHFFTRHNSDKPAGDFLLRDILRATSAAPSYFECKQMQSLSGVSYAFVDGGVFANNPAMCAYVEAAKLNAAIAPGAYQSPRHYLMLSLGTGVPTHPYEFSDAKDWGLASWPRPLYDMTISGSSEITDHQLAAMFSTTGTRDQYLRFNPRLPVSVKPEFDDASPENIQALKELGQSVAEDADAQLEAFVAMLLAEPPK